MKLRNLLFILGMLFCFSSIAQTFAPPFEGFSKKKTTFITMKDGSEKSVVIKKLFFKKGLIDDLKVVDHASGEKVKINPEEIKHMYVPPSNLAKLTQKVNAATDLKKLMDKELSNEYLEDGYLYMESSQVQVKKNKVQYCMLQVMNPTFSKKIKVYNDPFAGETAGVSVGGMKLAGGLAKSYYIKKAGEEVAKRMKKKEYKQDIEMLFSECPDVVEQYAADPNWSKFEAFIYDYSTFCE